MSEDLYAFTGSDQNTFKKLLFDNHRHLLDNIDFYELKELEALSHFLSWAGKFMPQHQFCDYTNAITATRIAHPETNRFYRLTLKHNFYILNDK